MTPPTAPLKGHAIGVDLACGPDQTVVRVGRHECRYVNGHCENHESGGNPGELCDIAKAYAKGDDPELLICAALLMPDGYIVRGHRHPNCLSVAAGMRKMATVSIDDDGMTARYATYELRQAIEGALTSRGRFVNRDEALVIFLANGGELKCGGSIWTSEESW